MYGQKKNFSTFSYKLVQISPIMILVNSGAFLSISSWFCELTELIFVMIPYISSSGYPPKRKGLWICASSEFGRGLSQRGLVMSEIVGNDRRPSMKSGTCRENVSRFRFFFFGRSGISTISSFHC